MALTPLTRVQQATVLVLVEARRLDVVPPDLGRADLRYDRQCLRVSLLPGLRTW